MSSGTDGTMSSGTDGHRGRSDRHADLLAEISEAAEIIAPLWPLTSFVAVNPLLNLQHRSFDEATAVARRWLRARTHLTLASFREVYDRGVITDADLRRAIVEVDPRLASEPGVWIGERMVDAVEIVRLDLLTGPDDKPRETAGDRVGKTDVATVRAATQIVAAWCAVFVDEAGVAWPMPGREQGFFHAWRDLAPHDRRLRRLAGPAGMRWLAALPDRPLDALAASLEALGVHGNHVNALREHLGRLPGWAGYARWHDEWAEPDGHRPALHLVDLLAVQVAATVAASHGTVPQKPLPDQDQMEERLLDERATAVAAALGSDSDPSVTSAVRAVLQQVPSAVRKSMWLEAKEGDFRDRLLGLLSRPDPGPAAERPDVQAAFCIDARSEGLVRHLEACGPYDTYAFAGFFGVPVRWRPLGSTQTQPRCPPLVKPEHEVTEEPLVVDGARRYFTAQRTAGAGHEAFHFPKGSLVGPFALAESAGYIMGPAAAARTLAPGFVRRLKGLTARQVGPPQTRPAIDAERDAGSGFALDERISFAESVVRTMGLTRFGRLVVLSGHGSHNVNNPHASSYDCGACGGAPGGPSARVVAAILNEAAVRAALAERGIVVPDDTLFVAAQHDTPSDVVTVLDREAVPETHEQLVATFERDIAVAGERLSRERARRLPGDHGTVQVRGHDWAQVRPEWGLASNAAFAIGPRSMTAGLDLACRVFLHSYDAESDGDGSALEAIMTAPLVVGVWISCQYYFSAVDPDQFGAGDKTLHNPVGGIGVMLGEGGDLQVGLPAQAVGVGNRRMHQSLRLLAIIQAPLERIEAIIGRNEVLQHYIGGRWMTLAARPHAEERWSIRSPSGTWTPWYPADGSVDYTHASLEVR